ncbi:MAG: DNA polymerase III subunit alpha [Clostridiales bacterium]|nr:DNA polymerase III subunit alpha [Clostridiales bacterium]
MDFAHLHVHTEYSLLDGACRIGELLDRAKALGQKTVAITDHGVMYGVVDFYNAAAERGIKPIIGCEVYVAARTRFDRQHTLDAQRYHLVLLCENDTGYKNLMRLVSRSWTEGFYTKPRVDRELLEKYHEGIIALSGCLAGEVSSRLLEHDYDGAKCVAEYYNDVFGQGNYYLEIQNHLLREQQLINPMLIRLSRETGIPLVATNDVHYVNKSDAAMQEILVCIQTNHLVGEDTGMGFATDEFYLKSEQEMYSLFADAPQAVENTGVIAQRCNVRLEFGVTKIPYFKIPDESVEHDVYFKNLCLKRLGEKLGGEIPEEYCKRLEYELSVIDKMGYTDYFLIVLDFVEFARSNGIPVGPGRGSAVGSLAAYASGITGLDPIKYHLLFERFLNPERVSMPDIDIDFCYMRRGEVIDYVISRYGADHVAQIVTMGTLAARAAIRDVGRVLDMPYSLVDTVAKQIPYELNITLSSAIEKNPDLKKLYSSDERVKNLIDNAAKIEGMPRHASTHAAGVVITADPVSDYVPLSGTDGSVVTQYTMTAIEELGLLKMDLLGLRTLTVIGDAEKMVRKKLPDFSVETLPLDDSDTFSELAKGNTSGVFQCESAGMTRLLTELKPEKFEDITAAVALYRPGPMYFIPSYLENRKHPEGIKYKTPALKEILDVTEGCMVYQEQVMQVFRTLAGYSYGRADVVRRAMSKKKHSVMEKEREYFIHGQTLPDGTVLCEGAVKNGVPEAVAQEIFNDMTSFASYAFNKSHSAAYALIAYRTAYLKAHHPNEFMAALLTSVLDNSRKVAEYIAECLRLGISVLPPDVNSSSDGFTSEKNSIRFGLLAVKNLGSGFINRIVSERESGGNYTSFSSFCKRVYGSDFNRRALESLIKCGALDSLGLTRSTMLFNMERITADLEYDRRRGGENQVDFFSMGVVPQQSEAVQLEMRPEMDESERLAFEKEITGLYISGHPMKKYMPFAEKIGAARVSELLSAGEDISGVYSDGSPVRLLAIITRLRKKTTKKDAFMAFAVLEDIYGAIETIIFPKTLEKYSDLLAEGAVVVLDGRLSLREDEDAKVVCDSVKVFDENTVYPPLPQKPKYTSSPHTAVQPKQSNTPQEADRQSGRKGLFLRFGTRSDENKSRAVNLLEIFDGRCPVYFYYCDTKEYEFAGNGLLTDINEPLLRELKRILGDDNVVFRK